MNAIIQRLWGFDKLIGPVLVKIIYYLGLAGIGLVTFFGVLMGVLALPASLLRGLSTIVITPLMGVMVLLFWRFICEAMILAFETYERLGEIRDRLPPRDPPPSLF